MKNQLLMVDGIVNLILGLLLIFFPAQLTSALDLPEVETFFYVNILGGVLFGIGVALVLERFNDRLAAHGLGIGGAIAINLSGAGVLVLWLSFGNMDLTPGGKLFLWAIALIVLGIACVEIFSKSWKEQ